MAAGERLFGARRYVPSNVLSFPVAEKFAGAPANANTAAAALIQLDGVSKTFRTTSGGTVKALDQVNLTIGSSEFVSVVGPSGCGKTTLLRIIAGLEGDHGGTFRLAGETVTGPSRDIGIVFQDATLLPWRTVLNNVLLPAQVLRLESASALATARRLLELVGLKGFEDKYPHELSGGMRQRVSIARALVHDPAVLLMDEPFGALDALTRETMGLELLKIWDTARKTVFLITHSITEAVFLSDRVIVLSPRPGRILADVPIALPRPRNLDMLSDETFGTFTRRIRRVLDASAAPPA
ncbi:MAG: ABC transporter ATP-binding protein [Rhodospirillales bacterium]|nr:ABC transporter ATP-binding protein [Rhodospirillales bacterium]